MNVNHGFITECTELPTCTLVSLENSQRQFSGKYCVEIPDTCLEKMKQISSSKNSSDNSSKASIDTLSQLQLQLETLNNEKTAIQNTLALKAACIDSLNKEKSLLQDTLTQNGEHIKTLQD